MSISQNNQPIFDLTANLIAEATELATRLGLTNTTSKRQYTNGTLEFTDPEASSFNWEVRYTLHTNGTIRRRVFNKDGNNGYPLNSRKTKTVFYTRGDGSQGSYQTYNMIPASFEGQLEILERRVLHYRQHVANAPLNQSYSTRISCNY